MKPRTLTQNPAGTKLHPTFRFHVVLHPPEPKPEREEVGGAGREGKKAGGRDVDIGGREGRGQER